TWWHEFWNRSWVFVESAESRTLPVNLDSWRVGVAPDGGSRFGGTITGPRVIRRALSAAEIAQLAAQQPATETELAEEALTSRCTVAAWIKPATGEVGRILNKGMAGKPDGITFDADRRLGLRWRVGDRTMIHPNCLKPGEWQHVAATADAGAGVRRIYFNGKLVKEERDYPAGESVTRGYVLQRFMDACSGRGRLPIKFNGSIFTVENQPGASPETAKGNPDWRRWGGNYWFQNTRLAYWPLLAAGDFDLMDAWFRMYLDALPLSKARIQAYYGFANAAQFPETMHWWGLPNNGDYGWTNTAPELANSYIARYWSGSLELVAVMLDRYDFTQDRQFARNTLVPLADPLIGFLNQYWASRDADGKIRFEPAQSLETWHTAVNPLPEIAGLRFLLPRLIALPAGVTTADQRARWRKMLDELPPVPVANVGGVKLLRPAESFSRKKNSENPELYAVFPYRLYGIGRPELDMARDTFARRGNRHNRGWCQDSIQAACLGLGDEAAHLVAARAAQINRGYRFPVMWGPNFDWTPDQDHGNNILTTLQYMLLQSDGEKIHLLPAWPKDWNVSFKLHAPLNTTVEGVYRGGKLEQLKVMPESRRKDVVISQ
ncbi:MAG: LamG-like jellyroll fold domain-containing protein, partial [Verrucomicrobiota bacterium]